MRYMGFVKMVPGQGEPPQALIEAMDQHIQRNIADGVFVDGGGLYSETFRTEIRLRGGEMTTIDGPFAEGREEVERRLADIRAGKIKMVPMEGILRELGILKDEERNGTPTT